jgi:hypothetical protein
LITDFAESGLSAEETVMLRFHSHLLTVTLIAAGIGIHAIEPRVESSLKAFASSPKVLAVRASYSLAIGDMDSALVLSKKAAEPSSGAETKECNHI